MPFQITAPSQIGYQYTCSGRMGAARSQATGSPVNSRQQHKPRLPVGAGCGVEFVGTRRTQIDAEGWVTRQIELQGAALTPLAAASLDDVASQAAKAGAKAAGVVIDDTAVTPGYVIGFEPKRELPIVGKIAAGSLRNKLLILLPAALVLSYVRPWTITPLLMLGGAYLCYEGVEKVLEAVMPHHAHQHEAQLGTVALNAPSVEDEKVASAIKTDFILSAEIMAITLAALPAGSIWQQELVLAVVAVGITVAVYGVVALIVKADDVGVSLARRDGASAIGRRQPRSWRQCRPH